MYVRACTPGGTPTGYIGRHIDQGIPPGYIGRHIDQGIPPSYHTRVLYLSPTIPGCYSRFINPGGIFPLYQPGWYIPAYSHQPGCYSRLFSSTRVLFPLYHTSGCITRFITPQGVYPALSHPGVNSRLFSPNVGYSRLFSPNVGYSRFNVHPG